jgi:hypothetical protein
MAQNGLENNQNARNPYDYARLAKLCVFTFAEGAIIIGAEDTE